MSLLKGAMNLSVLYALSRGLQGAITASLDMIEVNNLFAVSLGQSTAQAEDYVEVMSEITGLDTTNLKSSIGTFALLSKSMGVNTDNARILSKEMAELALDLSSLTNVPINQVMQDLRSGLVGQSETVYKYGLDVTEASLKQEAMNQGIEKSVRNMSQGEKMALRYSVMIKQSGLAHGDFAKTIETPANQLRILSERFTTLARSIGSIFIPVLQAVLPYLNALVVVATRGADAIAKMFGYMASESQGALSGLGEGAEDAENEIDKLDKSMQKLLKGSIDELNVINPNLGTGAGVQAGDPNDFNFGEYENFLDSVKLKSDEIANAITEKIGEIRNYLEDIFQPLLEPLETLSSQLGESLSWFFDEILTPIGEWTVNEAIPTFFETLGTVLETLSIAIDSARPALEWYWNDFLKPLGEWSAVAVIEGLEGISDALETIGFTISDNEDSFNTLLKILLAIVTASIAINAIWGVLVKVGAVLAGAFKVISIVGSTLAIIWNVLQYVFYAVVGALAGLGLSFGWIAIIIGAVIGAIILLIANWDKVVAVLTKFVEIVGPPIVTMFEAIVGGVVAFFEAVIEAGNAFGEFIKNVGEGISEWFADVKEGFSNFKTEVKEGFNEFITETSEFFKGLWEDITNGVEGFIEGVKTLFTAFVTSVVLTFLIVKESISIFVGKIRDGVVGGFEAFVDGVGTALERMKEVVSTVFTAVANVFITIWNGLVSAFESGLNFIISGINVFIEGINKALDKINVAAKKLGFKSVDLSVSTLSKVELSRVPQLARGGMLDGGQLFSAGEFGKSEIVGNFQGKTTVMPLENSGFTEAMYRAVASAIRETSAESENKTEFVVNLDGEVIYRNQQKVERDRGKKFNLGAFAR